MSTPDDDHLLEALPTSGLLSTYDRLRSRITATLERRGGRLSEQTVDALLLVPDVFVLLVRLMLDKTVPKETRMMVGGALAYFILPADLLPEILLGGAGYVDDLVLAVAVLAQVFGDDLEPYAERHWSGSKKLRTVIADVLEAAHGLLGRRLYDRLLALLSRRGIEVEPG
ncbi:MAG: DUF1232 domain-containing protein [Thermoanaerobaculia bacterium]|nr:DUF1232 domain-containing protein [Thermoanaerobaculia bacterium]